MMDALVPSGFMRAVKPPIQTWPSTLVLPAISGGLIAVLLMSYQLPE